MGFYLDTLPDDVKIMYLKRDVRGVVSSFKKRSLYERWNYEERFSQIENNLRNNQQVFEDLFSSCDKNNWIDKIITLYIINLLEIIKQLPEDSDRVLEINYEDIILDQDGQENEIAQFLSIKNETLGKIPPNSIERVALPNEIDGDFDTRKRKMSHKDWADVLSLEEEREILTLIKQKIEIIRKHVSPGVCKKIEEGIFFELDFEISRGKKDTPKKPEKPTFVYSTKSKRDILENNQFVRIPVNEKPGEGIEEFSMSTTLVTNEDYTVFLNELDAQGYHNQIGDNYIFYNIFMPYARGGRIIKDEEGYKVQKGYENHPVNWVSWLGAQAYAKWLGADMPSNDQWDRVCQEQLRADNNPTNTDHIVGDTTPVDQSPPNSLGIHDLVGNLKIWTQNWLSPPDENKPLESGFAKSTRGLSWNSSSYNAQMEDYKPFLMSARSLGIRLVKGEAPMDEEKFYKNLSELYTTILNNNDERDTLEQNRIITSVL